MAFECDNCGARNSEVQMGGVIPEKGVRFELRVAKGDVKARPESPREGSCWRLAPDAGHRPSRSPARL